MIWLLYVNLHFSLFFFIFYHFYLDFHHFLYCKVDVIETISEIGIIGKKLTELVFKIKNTILEVIWSYQ